MARDPAAPRGGFEPIQRVALDVKVVNAVGRSHARVGDRPASQLAMEAYARATRAREQTAVLCRANQVTYRPIVFTAQGGRSRDAADVIKQLSQLVATREGTPRR